MRNGRSSSLRCPLPAWKAGKGGRPAERCRGDHVDAIRYLVKEGIYWAMTITMARRLSRRPTPQLTAT